MPLGHQERFHYGERASSFGKVGSTPWSYSGSPLIGYDMLYTYRSGKRSKELNTKGSYNSYVRSGSIADQIRRRNEYLNMMIKETLEPTTGSPSVFSTTDSGHPFASYKVRAQQPYGRLRSTVISNGNVSEWDVVPSGLYPFPTLSDPFGSASYDSGPLSRSTYFPWPTYLFGGGSVSVSRQVVSNAVKNALSSGLIAGSNPWAPKASLATTILELAFGSVPTVLRNLRDYFAQLQSLKKTAGSDWLNVQFGWVPLISDIQDAVGVLFKLHMLLYGSEERRRFRDGKIGTWGRMSESSTTSIRTLYWTNPIAPAIDNTTTMKGRTGSVGEAPGALPSTGTRVSRTTRITADFRFSARFHRGARPGRREVYYLNEAEKLLGLEITPAVLWELAPWSWLMDWGSNLGSVAENLSQLDWSNVLLDYAYLTTCVTTDMSIGITLPSDTWTIGSVSQKMLSGRYIGQHVSSVEKIREQASPYGFSVSWEGLSPFQLSILAALGMSRGR
ncbi:maturation protein [ssRNA phage SRR5467091_10]|uniref:Maturation protein n=1 Tax=ssRNA phage SRR5467091_10 TaxID=2786460 RepID=A0A8S5L0D4_9VIRU|nr:maturation protein [ssRNA phage SRR5467091_10]DAD50899.1 TPA_asm: maturation protein [ssRNA phage SRR5467091_10]